MFLIYSQRGFQKSFEVTWNVGEPRILRDFGQFEKKFELQRSWQFYRIRIETFISLL